MGGKRGGVSAKAGPPGLGAAQLQDKHPRACLHRQLQKTRLCVYHMRGTCQYGTNCSFAHTRVELSTAPDLQRTRLCTSFANGQCDNPNCTFAHGEVELRSTDMFYKKAMCIWHERGRCRNGEFCRFAHGSTELRESADRSPVVTFQEANAQAEVRSADPTTVAAHAQALAAAFVAGQVAALPQQRATQQHWSVQHQQLSSLEQQYMAQQQVLHAQEMNAQSQLLQMPFISGEPMKVTSGNIMRPPQALRTEPAASAMQFGNVPKELAALGQLAIQLHQAGMPASPPTVGGPTATATGPAVAAGAFAALAALQDANLASHMANAQQHADSNLQSELGKLCESISTLSVQCNRLQQQVQSQLGANPGSAGSATTTAESLPGLGGFSEMGSSDGFSRQASVEVSANFPAMLIGNGDMGGLEAQDTAQRTAQWAAALRLVAGLQQ